MKRRELLVLPLLLLCPDVTLAAAGEATVAWTVPAGVTPEQIKNWTMQVGYPKATGGFGTVLITQWVGPTKRSHTFVALPPGKYAFRGFCTLKTLEKATSNVVSAYVK
jgi:hypothetical protein